MECATLWWVDTRSHCMDTPLHKDIDIWVEMTAENAAKITKALDQFGFGSLGLTASDFTVPDQMLHRYPPNESTF